MSTTNFTIRLEVKSDNPAIEKLLDQAFGEDRREKATYRFREGVSPVSDLCYVAIDQKGVLVGTIRFWPVKTQKGARVLLLGPLAVDKNFLGNRCGLALMETGIEQARKKEEALILLVGEEVYYGKVGFAKIPEGHFQFPASVESERILALELKPSALQNASGMLIPFKA